MPRKRLDRVEVSIYDNDGKVLETRNARIKGNNGAWVTPKFVKKQLKRKYPFTEGGFSRQNVWKGVHLEEISG